MNGQFEQSMVDLQSIDDSYDTEKILGVWLVGVASLQ